MEGRQDLEPPKNINIENLRQVHIFSHGKYEN
jgi:hypothetical protein